MKPEETSETVKVTDKTLADEKQVSENEAHLQCVLSAYPGIVAAGCFYPLCMGVLTLLWQATWNAQVDLADSIEFLGIFAFIGGMFGLMISALTGLISVGLTLAMNRSLAYPLDARSAAISAGSLAGYIPTAWVFFTPMFGKDFQESAAVGFIGPILAMSLGAIGAAWTSSRHSRSEFLAVTRRRKHRLSISHLMIATTWIAVVFSLANFFGGRWFAVAVAAWFGLQAIMLNLILVVQKFAKAELKIRRRPNETGSPKQE